RDVGVERFRLQLLDDAELLPEAHNFNVEIVVDELDFVTQLHEGLLLIQQASQDTREFQDHGAGCVGIDAHKRRNRIQRVEQKVRIDLALQRFHTRLQQQTLGF